MRLSLVLAAIAYVALFVGMQASAIPFCEKFSEAPICNPDDPDPCEIDPESCVPEPEPDPLPEPEFPDVARLEGTLTIKGEGFKERGAGELALFLNGEHFRFFMGREEIRGSLVPKNEKGTKFRLYFDDASEDLFASAVLVEAIEAGAPAALQVIGESSKLILKLDEDGTALLKLRSTILASGALEIHYNANLAGPLGPNRPE